MDFDDFRKGCSPLTPPKWDPEDWHSSSKETLPSLEDERIHLLLTNPRRFKPFNAVLQRFQNDYWVVD